MTQVILFLLISVISGSVCSYITFAICRKKSSLYIIYLKYYKLTQQWLKNRNNSKGIDEYFTEKGYKTIAIYGIGSLGQLFYDEIIKTDIKVKYIIDKDSLGNSEYNVPIAGIKDINYMEKVDCIIVTAVSAYEQIKESLENANCKIDIISLESLVFGL